MNFQTHKCNTEVSKLKWYSFLSLSYIPLEHQVKSHGCPPIEVVGTVLWAPFSVYNHVFLRLPHVYFPLVKNTEISTSVTHWLADKTSSCPSEQGLRTPFQPSPPHHVPGASFRLRENVTDITATHKIWPHLLCTLMLADIEKKKKWWRGVGWGGRNSEPMWVDRFLALQSLLEPIPHYLHIHS